MGNKQVKLGLRLDDKTFGLVTGRTYLNVTQEIQADGLHLLLIGEEYTQICHDERSSFAHSGERNYSSTHREIDRASASLVHMDVNLTTFSSGKIPPGQYEYPFEWELPSNLPGTMYCAKGDSHCEIRYRMTAYLSSRSRAFGEPEHSTTQSLCIVGQSSHIQGPSGIVMEPEVVRMKSCCFDSGQVTLGWDVDKTVASPDSVMKIGINGVNESKVEIQCLRARLVETISWSAHGRTEEEKNVLTEAKIPTTNLPQWHANHHHAYHHLGFNDSGQSIVETQLLLPSQARDTYSGSIIQVRHSLVITAVTPPCYTTVESGSLIRVQREAAQVHPSSIPTAPFDFLAEPTMVEADILPDDWAPQQAHVVTLPVSSAVLLDSEYIPPSVSAPKESLAPKHESQTANVTLSDLLDSLACSDDPVSAVSHHLNNPMMATTIQNLTPREFVQVLQAANRNVPKLARLLAGAMRENFQCRHVLACVWSLPPQVRLDVLKEVAPLASDLETQRSMVEQELDEKELLYFRAALK